MLSVSYTHLDVYKRQALERLGAMMAAPPETMVATAIAAAAAGATLGELTRALRVNDGARPTIVPLPLVRAAEPFEQLRRKTLSLTLSQGEREPDSSPLSPRERAGERASARVFLANLGPPRQHKARADFAQAFFEVGGFQVITNNGFPDPATAAAAAVASGAPAVVICSTDETYPDLVPPLVSAIRQAAPATVIVLAGRPAEQVEALQAVGVDEFIYMGADCVTLNDWLITAISQD